MWKIEIFDAAKDESTWLKNTSGAVVIYRDREAADVAVEHVESLSADYTALVRLTDNEIEKRIAASMTLGHTYEDAARVVSLSDMAHYAGTQDEFRALLEEIATINRKLVRLPAARESG